MGSAKRTVTCSASPKACGASTSKPPAEMSSLRPSSIVPLARKMRVGGHVRRARKAPASRGELGRRSGRDGVAALMPAKDIRLPSIVGRRTIPGIELGPPMLRGPISRPEPGELGGGPARRPRQGRGQRVTRRHLAQGFREITRCRIAIPLVHVPERPRWRARARAERAGSGQPATAPVACTPSTKLPRNCPRMAPFRPTLRTS